MKLKGEMVIELTDTNTGAVETVQETNMIGGILLFPAVLEEKADHIYEQGKNLLPAVLRNGGCFFHGRRILA